MQHNAMTDAEVRPAVVLSRMTVLEQDVGSTGRGSTEVMYNGKKSTGTTGGEMF